MATEFLSLGLLIATDEAVRARLVRATAERDREAETLCRLELSSRNAIASVAEALRIQYGSK